MRVLDFVHLGSSLSLSLRSYEQMGRAVSVRELARFGFAVSMAVVDFLRLGSSLTLLSSSATGELCSGTWHGGLARRSRCPDFGHLGSSLSLRSLGACW